MQLEAIGKPLRYRLKDDQELTLRPGQPVDVPDGAAQQLLRKAPTRVRVAFEVGAMISWQVAERRRHGIVDFVHRHADGVVWVFVITGEGWAAVNAKFASVITAWS